MMLQMFFLLASIFFAMICVRLLVNCCITYYRQVGRKADIKALPICVEKDSGNIFLINIPYELPPPSYDDAVKVTDDVMI